MQLKRILDGQFPSAQRRYKHLELGQPTKLYGPRAALVQQQLEELAGMPFLGARGPPRRVVIKSSYFRLTDFPRAAPHLLACRLQLRQAYGLSEELLARLIAFEKQRVEARASRNLAIGIDDESEDEGLVF